MSGSSDLNCEIHPLDLPIIAKRPPASALTAILDRLKVSYRNHDTPGRLDSGITQWLTRLVADDLEWIPDRQLAEKIRELAASRLAADCGVSARSNFVREIDVSSSLVVKLYEPGLTEDNLGFMTWGSSLTLSKRICQSHDLLGEEGSTVLELGAGTGLCGITAAKLGYRSTLTDLPEIVDNISKNVELNGVSQNCVVHELDWSESKPHTVEAHTVIISDPIYSKEHPRILLQAIANISACHILLLQFPLRAGWESDRETVYQGLKKLGFVQTMYEEELGKDDYGEMRYAFSKWTA